ncbi:hypothetical protein [Bacillus sp. FJAT-52991]|uniref:CopG family transcriptional regulator n=1 Tax=Bacillus kandeliae TaxID=3129297 RepID=A0ABZ2NBC2_9BACI
MIDINKMIEGIMKEKKPKKKQVGLYLDEDVLDKIGDQGRKGAKSEFVNRVLRQVLKENGVL